MELTQISLRTSRDQVERIKTYAKASNLSGILGIATFLHWSYSL